MFDTPAPTFNGYTQFALLEWVHPLEVVDQWTAELAAGSLGESFDALPGAHGWFYIGDEGHSFLGLWLAGNGEGQFLLVQTPGDDGWKVSEWAYAPKRMAVNQVFQTVCERYAGHGLVVPPHVDESGGVDSREAAVAFHDDFIREKEGQFFGPAAWTDIAQSWDRQ